MILAVREDCLPELDEELYFQIGKTLRLLTSIIILNARIRESYLKHLHEFKQTQKVFLLTATLIKAWVRLKVFNVLSLLKVQVSLL